MLNPVLLVLLASVSQDAKPKLANDIVYTKAGDQEMRLDIASPAGQGPFPCVVCIHGGGWRFGSRKDLATLINQLAGKGYVAVSISYRLSDKAPFPAQIEDCKAAIRWLRANAKQYDIDPERIGCLGMSAGAHLACLLGVTRKEDALEGNGGYADQSSGVRCVVSIFGPTDFSARVWEPQIENTLLVPFLGGKLEEKKEVYQKASPIHYVHKGAPPFLFFHGTVDKIVPVGQSRTMAAKLKEAGVVARLIEFEGAGHGWGGENLQKTMDETVGFLGQHLKDKK